MKQPLVSFCFTTYKRHDYLKKTLESIRLQSYTNIEVIVSDNDTEQTGRQAVESFGDPRFKYFPNETNLGMKKSFNESLNKSSGDFIVMIADDDPVYPDMLETLIDLHEKYPGFGMYMGGSNLLCTHPQIARLYKLKVGVNSCLADEPIDTVKTYTSAEFLKNFFNTRIFPYFLWSTVIVKRSILIEKGGIPDYKTPFLGDFAYMSIMGSHSGCVVINRALGHQTVHEQNFGRDQNEQLKIAAVNFIEYVTPRINHVQDWPVIKNAMERFVALWMLTHLAFLHHYFNLYNKKSKAELEKYEKEIMALPLMKPWRLKYWLKKNTPAVHDLLVLLKKKLNGNAAM
jgi:glycosyltransferase involved in cell wall biosynthesis